ncbi:hypothetical protein R3P38DRAFT_1846522 [Favolaschia claudopus]|uniref:F-box domain-containing protein n=1 Tax=Favolaschia claudopus TaxID=2862362 RepID=A0AAW0A2W6_9AGAR
MSPIPKLQKRIDKLSAAIEAQEQLLQRLIARRSEVQRELNYFSDPMARLPFELQSDIFMRCCIESYASTPGLDAPHLVLTAVSQLWRDVALATPRLWSDIQIVPYPHKLHSDYWKLCHLWLSRAQSLPVSLTIGGPLIPEQDMQDLVSLHSHRLANLTFSLMSDSYQTPIATFSLNEGTRLSSLKCLAFKADKPTDFGNLSQWLDVLRAAPVLLSMKLDNTFFRMDPGGASNPLTLPYLQNLHLGKPFAWDLLRENGSTSLILQFLTLPALKSLSISSFDISYAEFLAFLSRSSPPLESLRLAIPRDWSSVTTVAQVLRLMPTVVTLNLSAVPRDDRIDRFFPFLDVLSTSSDILPNLREITLRTDVPLTIDYELVLRMLRFRFTKCPVKLRSFRLTVPLVVPLYGSTHSPAILPPGRLVSGLEQLMEDGLKIAIGSWPGYSM